MTKSLCALAAMLLAGASVAAAQSINGAGATFPGPIYQKWFGEYHTAHPAITINYQTVGSGAGIAQLTAGTVDFGASDMPMTDDQISKLSVKAFHFPTVLGAVVPVYNIAGVTQPLKFSGDPVYRIRIEVCRNSFEVMRGPRKSRRVFLLQRTAQFLHP